MKGKIMRFQFSTKYTEEEILFLEQHCCKVLSEIELSRTNFSEYDTPRRMFQYYGTYIGEIIDDESKELVWAVLSKWKGTYHWSYMYTDLQTLEQGL